MAIEFSECLFYETTVPAITFDGSLKTYEPFSGEGWVPEYSDSVTMKCSRISNAGGASPLTLSNPMNCGFLDIHNLMTMISSPYPEEEILRVKLGKSVDPTSSSELWLTITLTYISNDSISMTCSVKTALLTVNPGSFDIEEVISNNSVTIYDTTFAPLYNYMGFGIDFLKLPDREDVVSQYLLSVFSYQYQSASVMDFTLGVSGGTYYAIPQSNTGSGTNKLLAGVLDLSLMGDRYGMILDTNIFSPEAGEPSEEGGYGTEDEGSGGMFDDSSDTIDIPNVPLIGVTNVGFVNVYKTGSQSLQNLGVELFPPLTYTPPIAITGTDVTDAIVNGFNQLVTFLANVPSFFEQITANTYINYIIDCHVLPVTPSGGTSENIKVGSKTLQATGDRLSNDYVDVDCGTISLAEYYQNFADFLTSFKLFLPFIGFVPARPEWFYRESLNVTYRFNVIDGSFMAFVRSTGKYVNNNNNGKTIVGQYGGNACVHLPITGATYASMVSGLVGAGAGMMVGAAAGNVPAVATSAISAATQHGDIAQSNAYASSVAFLGCRRPFVMIERPVSNFSETYAKEKGIPSNISRKLSKVSGFSMIGDVHLDGITATDAEKAEIERLLHEGVIL